MAKNTEKITIKIEGEKWQKALDKSFQKNVKNAKIDGFRKGNVPKNIYLERYGIASLYEEAINIVLEDAFQDALKKKTVEEQIQPSMDVVDVKEESVTLEFTFIGKPEIKLGEYKNLKIKKEKATITKEEVEHEMEHLREEFAEIRVKEDSKVETGDTAIINFKGMVDGKELEGGSGENYPLEIGTNTFIPGFEDGVKGMKVGEEKDLHLKFPEDYVKDLAGKEVVFHVSIEEIKTRVLPEMDENFFKDLGYDKVTNKEELYKEVEKVLKDQKEKDIEDKFMDEVLDKASNNMEVEIPEEITHDEIHRMTHQFEEQMKSQGLNLNQYFEFTHTTMDDLHKNMEPEAIKRIKYRYLLEEVAKKENIIVTEEEAEKDAEEMAQNYGITKEELIKAYGSMEVVRFDAKMRKTLEFLKENN